MVVVVVLVEDAVEEEDASDPARSNQVRKTGIGIRYRVDDGIRRAPPLLERERETVSESERDVDVDVRERFRVVFLYDR